MEDPLVSRDDTTPEEKAGFLSKLTFSYVTPILRKGFEEPLRAEHLPKVCKLHEAKRVAEKWMKVWNDEKTKPKPSIFRALIRCFVWPFQVSVLMEIIELIFNFFGPILMQSMLIYTQSVHRDATEGLIYVCIMFATSLFRALAATQVGQILAGLGMDMQTVMVTSIYTKAIRVSSRGRYTRGEIINIQYSDATRVSNTAMSLNTIWTTPANIVIAVILLLRTLGMAAFVGMAVMLTIFPLNICVFRALVTLRQELLGLTDQRVTMMNEMLSGIRVVKLTCLEEHFNRRILDIRRRELLLVKKQAYWHAMAGIVLFCVPIMVQVSTFATYSAMGYSLNAAIIFTSIALFGQLRGPLGMLPALVASFAEARISIRRLEKYLLQPENFPDREPDNPQYGNMIVLEKATFRWNEEDDDAFKLKEVNLTIPEGSLTVIVGKVGSGKSSLLMALLGEMEKTEGVLYVNGRISYSQQQAWLVNGTLRDNILFGSVYFNSEYQQVIDVCALLPDFAQLPSGDQTEIGEQGVNLSGGQKQRVSLARAVYNNGDIYLLDDPLSALDPHVGRHIFDRCLCGTLKEKTRILVTHQLQYLSYADQVVVMSEGKIQFAGTYQQLMKSDINIAEYIKDTTVDDVQTETTTTTTENQTKTTEEEGEKLIAEEDRATGAVTVETITWYIRQCGPVLYFFMGFLLCSEFTRISGDVWLSWWSDRKFWPEPGVAYYLGVFVCISFISSIFSSCRGLSLVEAAFFASVRLHNHMLANVLRAPLSFFDANPMGRILNRFSRDLDKLDAGIAEQLAGIISMLLTAAGAITVMSGVMPYLLIAFAMVSPVYYYLMRYYRSTSREMNRVVSTSASPIYSHFAESLSGAATIRAYEQADAFCEKNELNLDNFHAPYWSALLVGRWLAVRLELIGSTILFVASVSVVTNKDLPPGLIGLTLSYAMQITMILEVGVTIWTGIENEMNSVERVLAYCRDIPLEAPGIIPSKRPPPQWMSAGPAIKIQNLSVRYRPNLPDVLKGINIEIKPRSKVGIVGRTGSGKSSLLLTLLRLIEPHAGRILIDGVDVSEIGLKDLRSRIAIIPQDPVLFSGTLRQNLDPGAQHSDKEIMRALKRSHMLDTIEQHEDKLDQLVFENGANFSVGQRQLLCLARALLCNSNLLLMDEVTASVDLETDQLIHRTVAEVFEHCTVLTIAHRLDTIMSYDMVMVLGDGRVLEFGPVDELLKIKDGHFRGMVEDTGPRRSAQLKAMTAKGGGHGGSASSSSSTAQGGAASASSPQ